ncbi:DNA gyrase subunit A [subsurface metagenome]
MTLSNRGFIKRVPSHAYKPQHRGGKGIIGMVTRERDAVRLLVVTDTHAQLLFFTNRGKVFRAKCYEMPLDSSRTAKGTAVVNIIPVAENEKVTAMVAVTDFKPDAYLLMATRRGEIKKTSLGNFASVRSSGLIAMDLEENDELVAVCVAANEDDVLLITARGQSILFPVAELRTRRRTSGGVWGIRMMSGDRVVGMDVIYPDALVLNVTTNGCGKLTRVKNYPRQHRAGSGVRTFKITGKTGEVAASKLVSEIQQLMIISADGIVIRTPVAEERAGQGIPIQGRSTQGVKLMRLNPGDKVVAITCFD